MTVLTLPGWGVRFIAGDESLGRNTFSPMLRMYELMVLLYDLVDKSAVDEMALLNIILQRRGFYLWM
jgi:hypothetical protein